MNNEYKTNYHKYMPPTIPIYFIEYKYLKELLQKPNSVSSEGLFMMLGYFEEYEQYEKAALVRDALHYPNDGHEWEFKNNQWTRMATEEEMDTLLLDSGEEE